MYERYHSGMSFANELILLPEPYFRNPVLSDADMEWLTHDKTESIGKYNIVFLIIESAK